jgi:hypothetical protein
MASRSARIGDSLYARFSPYRGARLAGLAVIAIVLGTGGCSLFHHNQPTAQQKFIEALEHGNGPEANQIWLHMTDKERADWSHSEGMKPDFSKEDIENKLMQHAQEQADKDNDDSSDDSGTPQDGSAATSQIDTGNIDSQIIDMPGLDADTTGGSLKNLPGISGTDSTEPVGTGNAESPEAPVLLP